MGKKEKEATKMEKPLRLALNGELSHVASYDTKVIQCVVESEMFG
jgi:hypothetical protein